MAACPRCGFANNPEARFCGECGHSLSLAPQQLPAPPRERPGNSDKLFWLVGGLVAVVGLFATVVCIALIAVLYVQQSSVVVERVISTPVSYPTPTRPVPTPTPVAIATPLSRATSVPTRGATPVATLSSSLKVGDETLPVQQVILAEDFSRNIRDWKVERVEGLYMYLDDGRYFAEVRGPNTGWNSVVTASQTLITSDFAMLINAQPFLESKENLYGVMYGDIAKTDYYQFEIAGRGYFRIRYWDKDRDGRWGWQQFVDWQETGALKSQNESNTLAVVRRGRLVTFYLNGRKLYTFEDTRGIGLRQVGIYVGTWTEPLGVAFDDLHVATLR